MVLSYNAVDNMKRINGKFKDTINFIIIKVLGCAWYTIKIILIVVFFFFWEKLIVVMSENNIAIITVYPLNTYEIYSL